jgi:hypothetical protein
MASGLKGIVEYPLEYGDRIERAVLIFADWSAMHEFLLAPGIYISEVFHQYFSSGQPWTVGNYLTIMVRALNTTKGAHQSLLSTFNSLCDSDSSGAIDKNFDPTTDLFDPQEGFVCFDFADKTSTITVTYRPPVDTEGNPVEFPRRFQGPNSIFTLSIEKNSRIASGHVEAEMPGKSRFALTKLRADLALDFLTAPKKNLETMIKNQEGKNRKFVVSPKPKPGVRADRDSEKLTPEDLNSISIDCLNPTLVLEGVEPDPSTEVSEIAGVICTVCVTTKGSVDDADQFQVPLIELKLYCKP